MRRDKLSKLLQLRRMEVEGARAQMLAAEATENEARQTLREAQSAVRRETEGACSLMADDAAAEAFAKWLPLGRAAQFRAEAQVRHAEENLIRARTTFNLARSAAEAVEKLIADQLAAQIKVDLIKEQFILDEISQGRSL